MEKSDGKKRKIPAHISKETRAWIVDVLEGWDFSPELYEVVVMAAEAKDRYEAARKVLSAKGTTYIDRFGAPRSRPEVAIERDSRIAFLRCLSALDLQYEEEPEPVENRHPRVPPRFGGSAA